MSGPAWPHGRLWLCKCGRHETPYPALIVADGPGREEIRHAPNRCAPPKRPNVWDKVCAAFASVFYWLRRRLYDAQIRHKLNSGSCLGCDLSESIGVVGRASVHLHRSSCKKAAP